MTEFICWVKGNFKYIAPIITFFLGWLAKLWTLSRKERKDISLNQEKYAKELNSELLGAYNEFMEIMNKLSHRKKIIPNHVYSVMTAAEKYLASLKNACSAILSSTINKSSVKPLFLNNITEAAEELIPAYYEFLRKKAKSKNFVLKEENYAAILAVIDQYHGAQKVAEIKILWQS